MSWSFYDLVIETLIIVSVLEKKGYFTFGRDEEVIVKPIQEIFPKLIEERKKGTKEALLLFYELHNRDTGLDKVNSTEYFK